MPLLCSPCDAPSLVAWSFYTSALFSAEPDFAHDAFCMSECRKEKDEREFYCYSEFGKFVKAVVTRDGAQTSLTPFHNKSVLESSGQVEVR